jgi:hypothetical protein
MRIGRTPTICLLSISAAYAVAFVACGGESSDGDGNTGTGTTTNTTNTTSTTIVITGAGGAGGGTTGGTGGAGGGVIIDGDAACVAEPRAGEQVPLDLFFMVDKSGSMGCPVPARPGPACESGPTPTPMVTRWSSIKDALASFLNSTGSAGLGVGMGFFPQLSGNNNNNVLCNPQDYSTPAAAIAALPGSAGAIQAAIDAQMTAGNTPTVPALSGAIQYATSYAQTHPGRTVAIVFASDGLPTSCPNNNNNIPGAVTVAQAAFTGTPSIRTYVLGVGPNLQNLNQIAAAGGTMSAHLVESGGSAELITALNEIRKNALTCDYQIPVIVGKPLVLIGF